MTFEGLGFRQFRLKWGFGFRESFGLQVQGFKVGRGVLGRGCFKIDHY